MHARIQMAAHSSSWAATRGISVTVERGLLKSHSDNSEARGGERFRGEVLGVAFEPDILTDGAAPRRAEKVVLPERRLLIAILADALDCFQQNLHASNPKRQRLFREAEKWILADDVDWIFSFRNICEILGVDPEALRDQTRIWRRRRREAMSPAYPVGVAS